MEKENYIVINGIKYYPVYTKNAFSCFLCSFFDSDSSSCKLKNIGIKCDVDFYFIDK